MNCTILPLRLLDEDDAAFIYDNATRYGSDFRAKLLSDGLTDRDGTIAVVRDQGEIVGWARSELWLDEPWGEEWPTLEAFTREPWRRRGVCRYAVAGLLASRAFDLPVAVFHPRMVPLCHHLGVKCVEYRKERGEWIRDR